MGPALRSALLLSAALVGLTQEDPIPRAVNAHFTRYDAPKRADVATELESLWKTLPEGGDLRDRGLMRIIRTIEGATARFPVDPDRPDLRIPDRFHIRAYDLALRQISLLMANGVAYSKRSPETRASIVGQVNAVCDHALTAFVARAADVAAEKLMRERLESLRTNVFLKAVDEPFGGYSKPIDGATFEALKRKIAHSADALERVEGAEKLPQAFHDAALVIHEIGRAFDPARFATYDEDKALVEEVHAWRAEEKKKTDKRKESER